MPTGGVDDLHPDEHADEDERDVLEVVYRLMAQCEVIGRRHVPGGDHEHPGGEARRRPQERRQQAARRVRPGQRPHDAPRQDEEEERPAQRHERECRRNVADQDVLKHVAREQIGVADLVQRRHQGQRAERHREQEEQQPRPGGVIGAPEPPQPDECTREEQQREPGPGEDRRRRVPRGPELFAHWKISVVQSPFCNRTSCARAGPPGRSSRSTKKLRSTSMPPSGPQSTRSNHERRPG